MPALTYTEPGHASRSRTGHFAGVFDERPPRTVLACHHMMVDDTAVVSETLCGDGDVRLTRPSCSRLSAVATKASSHGSAASIPAGVWLWRSCRFLVLARLLAGCIRAAGCAAAPRGELHPVGGPGAAGTRLAAGPAGDASSALAMSSIDMQVAGCAEKALSFGGGMRHGPNVAGRRWSRHVDDAEVELPGRRGWRRPSCASP